MKEKREINVYNTIGDMNNMYMCKKRKEKKRKEKKRKRRKEKKRRKKNKKKEG